MKREDYVTELLQALLEGLARGYDQFPDKSFTGEQVAEHLRKSSEQLPNRLAAELRR